MHAHFDCFSGAAGDMMLGACLDASPNPSTLLNKIRLNLKEGIPNIRDEFEISMVKVWRGGMGSIAAIKVEVQSVYGHAAAPIPKDLGNDTFLLGEENHDSSSHNNCECVKKKGGDEHHDYNRLGHAGEYDSRNEEQIARRHEKRNNKQHRRFGKELEAKHDHGDQPPTDSNKHSELGTKESILDDIEEHKGGTTCDHAYIHNHGQHSRDSHAHVHGHSHNHSSSEPVLKNPIKETKLDDEDELKSVISSDHEHTQIHNNEQASHLQEQHSHDHSHAHSHGHSHDHSSIGPLRNLPHIIDMLQSTSAVQYIPERVRELAIQTFTELAIAESYTHGTSGPETVHFHEVGAIDSIVDVIGTLLALHHLSVSTVSCSRLPMGEGSVWTDHGELPVPAFATMRLLIGMKTCPGPGNTRGLSTGELVTPTAAALLRVLTGVADAEARKNGEGMKDRCVETASSSRVGRPPMFTPRACGMGAGSKDFVKHPNIVRLMLGDDVVFDDGPMKNNAKGSEQIKDGDISAASIRRYTNAKLESAEPPILQGCVIENEEKTLNFEPKLQSSATAPGVLAPSHQPPWKIDRLTMLTTNIDDITPEILSHTMNLLLDNGAIDAWVQPIVMKKGRSAHTLNCLCHSSEDSNENKVKGTKSATVSTSENLLNIIFRHTTTLGVRIQRDIERVSLYRRYVKVQTPYGLDDVGSNYGIVNVKLGVLGDDVVSTKAEFNECKIISEITGVPVKKIADYATRKIQEQYE